MRFICFSDQNMDDAFLDNLRILSGGESEGWWNLYDEATEVEQSFIYAGDEPETDHDDWEALEELARQKKISDILDAWLTRLRDEIYVDLRLEG